MRIFDAFVNESSRQLEREAKRSVSLMLAVTAREAMDKTKRQAFADRAYCNNLNIKASGDVGITAFTPKPMTSNSKAHGRFGKAAAIYISKDDEYKCPAGERAICRGNACPS